MVIQLASTSSLPVSSFVTKFLGNDRFPYQCGFLNSESSLFWIAQKNRLIVVDALNGSTVSSFSLPNESIIVFASSLVFEDNNPGLYLATEKSDDDKSIIFLFDILEGKILASTSIKNKISCISTIKDANLTGGGCFLHPNLRKVANLFAVGTEDGHLLLINQDLTHGRVENRLVSKIDADLDSIDRESNFCVDLIDFLHSKSSFFWTDDLYSRTLEKDLVTVTSVKLIAEANILAVGFKFGSFLLLSLENGRPFSFEDVFGPVVDFAVQEAENDPRATLFLWIIRNDEQNLSTLFELLQLSFERKNPNVNGSKSAVFERLEICIPKFRWSPDNCSDVVLVQTLVLNRNDNSENNFSSSTIEDEPDRSLVYFLWKRFDDRLEGGVFDINAWYHAQMPNSLSDSSTYFALHSFDVPCSPDALAAKVLTKSVQRFGDGEFSESDAIYFANSLGISLTVVNSSTIFTCRVESLLHSALERLVSAGPKILTSTDAVCEIFEETGLIKIPSNLEEMRWNVFDQMLTCRRSTFLLAYMYEFRANEELTSDLVDFAWNRTKLWKNTFQNACDREFVENSGNAISAANQKMLEKCASILNDLLTIHAKYVEVCEMSIDKERLRESKARCEALRLISEYVRTVVWFFKESVCQFADYSSFKKISLSKREFRYFSSIKSKLREIAKAANVDVNVVPKCFQDLLNVYLMPNADLTIKHAFFLYNLLNIVEIGCANEENIEKMRQSCESFAGFVNDECSIRLVFSMWYSDRNEIELAKKYCMQAVLRFDPDVRTVLSDEFHGLVERLTPVLANVLAQNEFRPLISHDPVGYCASFDNQLMLHALKAQPALNEADFVKFALLHLTRFGLASTLESFPTRFVELANIFEQNLPRGDVAKTLMALKCAKFDDLKANEVRDNEEDGRLSICSKLKRKFDEILPKSTFEPKKMTASFPTMSSLDQSPLTAKICTAVSKRAFEDSSSNLLKRNQAINTSTRQPTKKKHKTHSNEETRSERERRPILRNHLDLDLDLSQFDDILSVLSTPKNSGSFAAPPSSSSKREPVSILKVGASPALRRKLPASLDQNSPYTATKHFRFDLPPSPDVVPSKDAQDLIRSVDDDDEDLNNEQTDSSRSTSTLGMVQSAVEKLRSTLETVPTLARPSLTKGLDAGVETASLAPLLDESYLSEEEAAVRNYLSEESFFDEEEKKERETICKVVEFFTPTPSKTHSFDLYAKSEMESLLRSISRNDDHTELTNRVPLLANQVHFPANQVKLPANQVLLSERQSVPEHQPSPEHQRSVEQAPANQDSNFRASPANQVNFLQLPANQMDKDDSVSMDSDEGSIADRVKISPRSAKRLDDWTAAATEEPPSGNKYNLRRTPIRRSQQFDVKPKRIVTPVQPTAFAKKLNTARRKRLSTIPKELLIEFAFSPPNPVELDPNLVDEDQQEASTSKLGQEEELTTAAQINFVFSPPITRSKAKLRSSAADSQSQTTPFHEKLRRRSIRKSTRSTHSAQLFSKPATIREVQREET